MLHWEAKKYTAHQKHVIQIHQITYKLSTEIFAQIIRKNIQFIFSDH
jgi:hypothetical protein